MCSYITYTSHDLFYINIIIQNIGYNNMYHILMKRENIFSKRLGETKELIYTKPCPYVYMSYLIEHVYTGARVNKEWEKT